MTLHEFNPVEAMLLDEIRQLRQRPLMPLMSRLAREAGIWRKHAETLAGIVRTELRPTDYGGGLPPEITAALNAYDELVALVEEPAADQ